MHDYWVEFLKVAVAHLLAVASPGPDFALVLRQSLSRGRSTAICTSIGIGMAIPVFQVKNIIEKHDVILKSANFELYGDMSARVMELLEDYSSDIQIYSIDEAFFLVPDHLPLDCPLAAERQIHERADEQVHDDANSHRIDSRG